MKRRSPAGGLLFGVRSSIHHAPRPKSPAPKTGKEQSILRAGGSLQPRPQERPVLSRPDRGAGLEPKMRVKVITSIAAVRSRPDHGAGLEPFP